MMRTAHILVLCTLLWYIDDAAARPSLQAHQWSEPETEVDVVGDVDGMSPAPRKALQDTIWIANWTFDTSASCDVSGWTHVDNHVLYAGDLYWHMETGYSTSTGMAGNSYAAGYHNNVCCENLDGYDNDWYQGLRMEYQGAATLSFDYIVDSEAGYDFLQIESDSACASYDLVDFDADPSASAASFRTVENQIDGLITDGEFVDLALTDYGAGTHCAFIAFFSDGGYSPCDGLLPTSVGEAIVIDNIELTYGGTTYSENFDTVAANPLVWTALDMRDSAPFGTWARVFHHITDNDICAENITCAWLWTDYDPGTLFNDPSMAFAPGGFVIKNWLDDIIISPWVSLATTPTATGTVLEFRRFNGNNFSTGRIVQNWSVRGKGIIDGVDCMTNWGHSASWNSLSSFYWGTYAWDMSSYFDPAVEEIQVRLRVSDWQWIANSSPPSPFVPGPGPFVDRIRIGRRVLSGPVIIEGIDNRSQAQDCFPTEIDPNVTPAGRHVRPTTDRFGTCDFSQGTELAIGRTSPFLVTGDSIHVAVNAVRSGGDVVTAVQWNGAIVAGPHAGKAPPPYTVGGNGFFTFDADSVRSTAGTVLADQYFVSLDDEYFRGSDQLVYLWSATDNGGGYASDPVGLNAPPASIDEAQLATEGMLEVSYLPAINWDPAYLARIQADPNGKLDPTTEELANSTQQNCILYAQSVNRRRLSGDVNRTSFMYTLDLLGYAGHYDVYDVQGYGNTNNQLGGRATVEQAQGYNLIIFDLGNWGIGFPLMPDGIDLDSEKIDQAGWFSSWLDQASLSEAQFATLWIVSSHVLEEKSGVAGSGGTLLNTDMGVQLQSTDQGMGVNPDVVGLGTFTFDHGIGSVTIDFSNDEFVLHGACQLVRSSYRVNSLYNGAATSAATALATHRYRSSELGQTGDAAIVMNRNDAEAYNTIMQTHPWLDIRDPAGTPDDPSPEASLLYKILGGVLPPDRLQSPGPTGVTGDGELNTPAQTSLHQNVPNPFNPTTTIRFDLAEKGHVSLRVYNVAGRLVRTLLDEEMPAGWNHRILWDGLDRQGTPVSSGLYFYRLEAGDFTDSRKMVVLR